MSNYNTQLQSNNTDLQQVLQALQSKAAGGGYSENEDAIINRTITSYTNNRVTKIGSYAFSACTKLVTVNFPAVTDIEACAFDGCTSLTTASFPAALKVGNYAFHSCRNLLSVNFPKVSHIWNRAFESCYKLTTVNFPAVTSTDISVFNECSELTTVSFPALKYAGNGTFYSCRSLTEVSLPAVIDISANVFKYCSNLTSLYLTGSSICTLYNQWVFEGTGITSSTGFIYVPESLVTSYKAATNWAYFSNVIYPIPNLITFTIDDIEYQAENGMTWAEWVESSYNPNLLNSDLTGVEDSSKSLIYFSEEVLPSDVIEALGYNLYAINDWH